MGDPIGTDTTKQKTALGINDLLDAVPGVWREFWSGEVKNSLSTRGTRPEFNTYISFQEDGLPISYSPFLSVFEIRHDLTFERVESILARPSGVFTAQGATATVNFINRLPKEEEGEARFSVTDYGNIRADVFYGRSVPGSDNWTFAAGVTRALTLMTQSIVRDMPLLDVTKISDIDRSICTPHLSNTAGGYT